MLKAKNVHFVGIGGIGVSAIAQILKARGIKISGSDTTPSQITKNFKLADVKIQYEHKASNISKKHDLVIYSPAVPNDNPELKKARELKIKILSYADALGELSKEYFTVAIAGTHGKSTTTAMTSLIAVRAGLDPTVVIGTKLREFKNRNYRVGESTLLIVEACEYKETFLKLHPNIIVITNIEADHLDYYKTFNNYKKAFKKFTDKLPVDGVVIKKGEYTGPLSIPGEFNRENAGLAASAMRKLGVSEKKIEQTLKNYKGSWRRMEYKKKIGKTQMIDDYAHHPTEIKLTLGAIREKHPDARILTIYQPHQYNRTHHFLKQFGTSFGDSDEVIIPDIYKVRDTNDDLAKVSPEDLVKEISKHHKKVSNGEGIKKTAEFIKKNYKNYDLIITMGAGNIDGIYRYL